MDNWRHFFYYTFGLLPSVFFGLRFLIQWISSEKKKKSTVSKAFWYLSLCGNFLLTAHYFIQLQFLLMLIQVINGFISWRNLDLLTKKRAFNRAFSILLTALAITSLLFFSQFIFISMPLHILEIPAGLLGIREHVPWGWHLFGALGCLLFASRFWIQWIEAEKSGESKLGKNFWLISIVGSVSAFIYFFHIKDWVSCINYSCGMIPYIRNLILLYREKAAVHTNS